MNNIKYTGTNIAAAALILFYFFPWVNAIAITMSGFSLTTNGLSPGIMSYFISGLNRLFMILAVLVPLSGAIILYQNITGNIKFSKFYKPAHFIPVIYLLVGLVGLYFKMKPDVPKMSGEDSALFQEMSKNIRDMTPGAFDVLSYGFYLSVAAAIYLLLVNMGKIKDKEYYKPADTTKSQPPTENSNNP